MNGDITKETGALNVGFEDTTALIFTVSVIMCLMIDFFCHRKDHEVSFMSASLWSLFWIVVSLCFAGYLWFHFNLRSYKK